AWGPVQRGNDFLWRDLKDSSLSASRKNELTQRLNDATTANEALRQLTSIIREELGLGWSDGPSDARHPCDLLLLLDRRPDVPIPTHWLSRSAVTLIWERLEALSSESIAYEQTVTELTNYLGDRHEDLDSELWDQLVPAMSELADPSTAWL